MKNLFEISDDDVVTSKILDLCHINPVSSLEITKIINIE